MKRKMLSVILVLAIFLSIGVFQAFAATEAIHGAVDLKPTESRAYSEEVSGCYCTHSGSNASTSKHRVYFVPEYLSGSSWYEDASKQLLYAGDVYSGQETYVFATEQVWHLELDAYGPYKECTASGYITAGN